MLISLLVVGGAAFAGMRLLKSRPRPRTATAMDDPPATDDRVPGAAAGEHPDADPPAAEPTKAEPDPTTTSRHLAIAGGALGLNVAGAMVAPPLALLSSVPLLVVSAPVLRQAYAVRRDPDRRWVAAVDAFTLGGSIITGHLFAASLAATLIYGSKVLLLRTRRTVRDELGQVFGELPARAVRLHGAEEVEVAVDEIGLADLVLVRAGTVIPIDGFVVEGCGSVDQQALTGESAPQAKVVGDPVFAATLVIEGPLVVQVSRTGAETTVGRLGRILQKTDDLTEHHRSVAETFVERGAPMTLALSAMTLPLAGVTGALAVAYVSFGYQMRLAGPVAVLGYIRRAAQQRVLVKDGRALELLTDVDVVLFDKTGTLTCDAPEVVAIRPFDGYDAPSVLRWAAAMEVGQTHPIARAILAAAAAEGIEPPPVERLQVDLGAGLRARIDGVDTCIGSRRLVEAAGIVVPDDRGAVTPGCAPIYVTAGKTVVGVIELATPARPESRAVIADLKARGFEVALVTGDRAGPAERLARQLGIDEVHAEVLPAAKSGLVESLQAQGRRVCFVGDGINDAIALKAADVGISLSGASAAATDVASLVMLDGDLTRLPALFDVAHEFGRNVELSKALTVAPGVLCVGGVHFAHMGLAGAIMLYNVTLGASIANALRPSVGSTDPARAPVSPAPKA